MNHIEAFRNLSKEEQFDLLKEWFKPGEGYLLIAKKDHELLLKTQADLIQQVDHLTQKNSDSDRIMSCEIIKSLTGLLSLPLINYLDDFGKKEESVSVFSFQEISTISHAIMMQVKELLPPKAMNKTLTDEDLENIKKNL